MIFVGNKKYELIHENKTAWNAEVFRDRYSDILERYDYILGDWGYNQLRLKGFYRDGHPKAGRDTSYAGIMEYINEYCNFGCAYFILELKESLNEEPGAIPEGPGEGDIVIEPGVRRFEEDSYSRQPAAGRSRGDRSAGKRGSEAAAEASEDGAEAAVAATAADTGAASSRGPRREQQPGRRDRDNSKRPGSSSSGDRRGPRREPAGTPAGSGERREHVSGGDRRGPRREGGGEASTEREHQSSGESRRERRLPAQVQADHSREASAGVETRGERREHTSSGKRKNHGKSGGYPRRDGEQAQSAQQGPGGEPRQGAVKKRSPQPPPASDMS